MAARKSPSRVRTVYRTAKRSIRRRASSGGGLGKIKTTLLPGLVAGAAAPIVSRFVPGGWGNALTFGGVGYFMKNDTLMTLAGVSAGQNLAPMVSGLIPGGNTTSSGGFL